MTMRRCYVFMMALIMAVTMNAQDKTNENKFSPERFEAELQNFITHEAHLSAQEASKFFPIYKEMQQKQRAIFERQRQMSKEKPQTDEGCLKAIQEHDEMDIELKRIQQTYHKRFMEVLPASKVFDVLKAESRFHRKTMRNWGQRKSPGDGGKHPRAIPAGKRSHQN